MPQGTQTPAAGDEEDPVSRYEAAGEAFAEDLRDLHIRCGKPKQSALVAEAARCAAEKRNEKFRLHPGTLSVVLRGLKTPTHDFLSALILQLVQARPSVGEYKDVWAQWDLRWQDLMRLKSHADTHRTRHALLASSLASDQPDPVSPGGSDEAARIIAEARREAAAIRDVARAEAAEILLLARARVAAATPRRDMDSSADTGPDEVQGQHPVSPDGSRLPSWNVSQVSPRQEVPEGRRSRPRGDRAIPPDVRSRRNVEQELVAGNGSDFGVAVYRWMSDRGRAGTGMAAVAYSMPEDQAAEQGRKLGPLLWMSQEGRAGPSQVRTIIDDTVMAVYRVPTVDVSGRPSTISHVLSGSPSALTASRTILLDYPSLDLLERASGTIPPRTAQQLAFEIQNNHSRFIEYIPRLRRHIEVIAAQLMRTPHGRLSFLPPVDNAASWEIDPARLLIWALCAMLEQVVGDTYFTYSSFDAQDSSHARMACVRYRDAWGSADKVQIDFDAIHDDEAAQLAHELVGIFLQIPDRPEILSEWLGLSRSHSPRTAHQSMEALTYALRRVKQRSGAGSPREAATKSQVSALQPSVDDWPVAPVSSMKPPNRARELPESELLTSSTAPTNSGTQEQEPPEDEQARLGSQAVPSSSRRARADAAAELEVANTKQATAASPLTWSSPDLIRAVKNPERDAEQIREQALHRSPAQFVELYARVRESEREVMMAALRERHPSEQKAITVLLVDALYDRPHGLQSPPDQ